MGDVVWCFSGQIVVGAAAAAQPALSSGAQNRKTIGKGLKFTFHDLTPSPKPVIAAGLALGLLGDELSLLQAAAMLVVMASVLVEVFWPRFGRRPEGGASGN